MRLNTGLGKEPTAGLGKGLTKKQKAEQKEQTANQKEPTAKVEDSLERLQGAAHAGHVKFRGGDKRARIPADRYQGHRPSLFLRKARSSIRLRM